MRAPPLAIASRKRALDPAHDVRHDAHRFSVETSRLT